MTARGRPFASLFDAQHQQQPQQAQQPQRNGYSVPFVGAQAQGESPAHRIYQQRSARTFSQIMGGSGASGGSGSGGVEHRPDYLQEHRANPYHQYHHHHDRRHYSSRECAHSPSPSYGDDAAAYASPSAPAPALCDSWMSRQERLLRDIDDRLDRLEEQQRRRRFSAVAAGASDNGAVVAGDVAAATTTAAAAAAATTAANNAIARLLEQMQEQQRHMHRMQQQMDELRHAMELAAQRERFAAPVAPHRYVATGDAPATAAMDASTLTTTTTTTTDGALAATTAVAPPRLVGGALQYSAQQQQQQQQQQPSLARWFGAALIVTFAFALLSILIAIIAVARSTSARAAASAAKTTTTFVPLDLSQSSFAPGGALLASAPAPIGSPQAPLSASHVWAPVSIGGDQGSTPRLYWAPSPAPPPSTSNGVGARKAQQVLFSS